MPRSTNIRQAGFQQHYELWLEQHPDAVPYDKLMGYIRSGDEFGRRVSARKLAMVAKTTKTTMLKWLQIIADEEKTA